MQFRITWMAIGLMMAATDLSASTEPSPSPEPVVRQQAYRCLDGSGRVQYQQQACAHDSAQQAVQVRDDRTHAQQRQARQLIQQDQDLARQIASTRHRQERQDQEATAHARRLTEAHRPPVATHHVTLAESQHVISRRRDFRAASAKTAKRARSSAQAKPTQQSNHQAG